MAFLKDEPTFSQRMAFAAGTMLVCGLGLTALTFASGAALVSWAGIVTGTLVFGGSFGSIIAGMSMVVGNVIRTRSLKTPPVVAAVAAMAIGAGAVYTGTVVEKATNAFNTASVAAEDARTPIATAARATLTVAAGA